MAQKKVGWTGHINENDTWLSFKKNGKQYIESNDDNVDKISELIEFSYALNDTPSERSTNVIFTQNKTNKQIILPVNQKAGHVKIHTTVSEKNISYEQSVTIVPESKTISSSESTCDFTDFIYKLTEYYDSVTSFTWSDTGEPGSDVEPKSKEPIIVKATENPNDFKTEISGKSVTGTGLTVKVGSNKHRTDQHYTVTVTYIGDKKPTDASKVNGKDYNVATITQSKNENERYLNIAPHFGKDAFTWKYNEFGENYVSACTISPTFTDGGSSMQITKYDYGITSETLENFTYSSAATSTELQISAYPNSENTDENQDRYEVLTITASCNYEDEKFTAETTVTLTQEKAAKSKTEYDFEVEPIRLEWPGNSYGEETAQTLSVTSRTRTYREGEDANSANWKAVPFTASNLTHFKYDGAKDPQIVYPVNANTSIDNPITEILTFTQDVSNYTKSVTLTHYQKDLIFFKSDYLILKYSWDGDTDIDTATVINTPLTTPDKNVRFDAAPIGFNQVGTTTYQNSTKSFIEWGGDTRTSGDEGALIDLKSLAEYISGLTTDVKNEYFRLSDGSYVVEIEVYANHFSGDTTQSASVSYTSYVQKKGMTISNSVNTNTHTFTVENGEVTANGSANIRVFAKGQPNANGDFRTCYTKIASIYYDLEKGTVMMTTNSTNDFDDKNGNTLYGYRGYMNIKNYAPTTDLIDEKDQLEYVKNYQTYDAHSRHLPITGGTYTAKIISQKENINMNLLDVPVYIMSSSVTDSASAIYDSNEQLLTVTLKDASKIQENFGFYTPCNIIFAQEHHPEQNMTLYIYQNCNDVDASYFSIWINGYEISGAEGKKSFICVNSDGTSLSNKEQSISITSSDSKNTSLPFILSCTTDNAINTITTTGDTNTVFTSSYKNLDKSDKFFVMEGTQYDKEHNKVLNKKNFHVLQLGTYQFEVTTNEKLDAGSSYTLKDLTSEGSADTTYKFTVISTNEKGEQIGFSFKDVTNYGTTYTKKASINENKNNSFDIIIPQNQTNHAQYFYFTLTQNDSENKRYIRVYNNYK